MKSKAALLLILSAFAGAAGAAPKWEERYYNPKPAKDDVVLPLPCEGALVFRKIVVPAAGPLDDLPINVGQESENFAFLEQRRIAHIAGSFTEQGS